MMDVPKNPADVMKGKFDYWTYLQGFLHSPGVRITGLHPIFGLRLAALFTDLTHRGLASPEPGKGQFSIYSGVRTKAKQVQLYEDICLRQKRCAMVANPYRTHGPDSEGVQRAGSNHMEQPQHPAWGASLGYAVDIAGAKTRAQWKPCHDLLPTYGIGWPLKNPAALEMWHFEWFSRSMPAPLDGPVAWPERPGVHRPLCPGMLGGDVGKFQEQAATAMGYPLIKPGHKGVRPANAVMHDGDYGPASTGLCKAVQVGLKVASDGVWKEPNQVVFEAAAAKREPPKPLPDPPVTTPTTPDPPAADDVKWASMKAQTTRLETQLRGALQTVDLMKKNL